MRLAGLPYGSRLRVRARRRRTSDADAALDRPVARTCAPAISETPGDQRRRRGQGDAEVSR